MRRRTFKLAASYVCDMRVSREPKTDDIRLRRFLHHLGFGSNRTIRQHTQFDGGILFVQDIPDDDVPAYDLVSMILLEGGFPKECVQRVLERAWEEDRDPVEIARLEVELVEKLGG